MLKNIAAAFQFLTVLPIPIKTQYQHLQNSIQWFPLVGAFIGLATGLGYQGLNQILPPNIAAALTIGLYIILTRGLHLDGFMDTIDGFFSRKDPTTILEIMKESTVGSFAVLGAGLWFLVLFTTLPTATPMELAALHASARLGVPWLTFLFPYARPNGTGKVFTEQNHHNPKPLIKALTLTLTLLTLIVLTPITSITPPALMIGLLPLLALAIATLTGRWSQKKISGITGDVMGFTIETLHLTGLLFLALWKYTAIKAIGI